jgi:hypothetical protein
MVVSAKAAVGEGLGLHVHTHQSLYCPYRKAMGIAQWIHLAQWIRLQEEEEAQRRVPPNGAVSEEAARGCAVPQGCACDGRRGQLCRRRLLPLHLRMVSRCCDGSPSRPTLPLVDGQWRRERMSARLTRLVRDRKAA